MSREKVTCRGPASEARPEAIKRYSVQQPIITPIVARRGHVLAVWPENATHTLSVCSTEPGYPVLRHCAVPIRQLYAMVLRWQGAGVIAPLPPACALGVS